MGKQIGSSLTVLMVADAERSQRFYRDVLGFDVTDWWAQRDGLTGLALKLIQVPEGRVPTPNPAESGADVGVDVYAYTETWAGLDALYEEFKRNGAAIAKEPAVYADFGPWKEFVVEDPDGYHLAFGGVDGGRARFSIQPRIDSVFVWVRRLDRAAALYANLLGLEVREEDRYGHLHLFRLDNGTDLILDSNGMAEIPVPERGPVQFKLDTYDIDRARTEALALGFTAETETRRLPSVSYFVLRDEDGNRLMISQNHR
ncbi:VOC family protein [Cohnella zeiphila]|uniref:VOC family protein n=1 Tax=Cohnella zeiphila TaxID=2761120 RepID=A0A7X0VVY1_9BACL|nr:VOC family protein [Cohnella zeiphila]MBB6732381.1 VOC family protein [Cohnella zeiphila]